MCNAARERPMVPAPTKVIRSSAVSDIADFVICLTSNAGTRYMATGNDFGARSHFPSEQIIFSCLMYRVCLS